VDCRIVGIRPLKAVNVTWQNFPAVHVLGYRGLNILTVTVSISNTLEKLRLLARGT